MNIEFDETGRKLSERSLVAFERKLSVKLPEDYREFLLRTNGGYPADDLQFQFIEGDRESDSVLGEFYTLAQDSELGTLQEGLETFVNADRMPPWCLPIADDAFGNQICLSLNQDDFGAIYFWNHELEDISPANLYRIARSFIEFIAMLKELEE
jgi:hypothetical protein